MKKIITAKEQFENDVKDMNYADEVCGFHYYYTEKDGKAYFYAGSDELNDYSMKVFPTFSEIKMCHGLALTIHFIRMEINTESDLRALNDMTADELVGKNKFFTTYCDFLFCNGGLEMIGGHCFKDEEVEVPEESQPGLATVGAEHTDVNAFSFMINHIKTELISRIEGLADCLEIDRFAFNPRYGNNSTFCTYCIDGDNFFFCAECGTSWFENENGDVLGDLDDCTAEELIYLYSVLHK